MIICEKFIKLFLVYKFNRKQYVVIFLEFRFLILDNDFLLSDYEFLILEQSQK